MAKIVFIILSLIFIMHDGADGNQHCYKKKATQNKCKTTNETCNNDVSGNCQTSADCTGNGGSITTETDPGADCCNDLVCCESAPPPYCPRLSLDNGQVEYNGTGVGEIATFSCQENYTLCGHDAVQCNDNGEWDKGLPVCITDSDNTNVNVTYEGSSYLFVLDQNNYKNFDEAQEFCEDQGGYLVAINSEEELECINCVRNNTAENYSYIGLINPNGTWIWTSGQSISITDFFLPNEPFDSTYCGFILSGESSGKNKWITSDVFSCSVYYQGFICEIPL